jgi:hypothetical protein
VEKHISIGMGYVRTKVSVAIAKATSACIQGEGGARGVAREFEDGAALASILMSFACVMYARDIYEYMCNGP